MAKLYLRFSIVQRQEGFVVGKHKLFIGPLCADELAQFIVWRREHEKTKPLLKECSVKSEDSLPGGWRAHSLAQFQNLWKDPEGPACMVFQDRVLDPICKSGAIS